MSNFSDQEMLTVFISDASEALNVWERACLSISEENLSESLKNLMRCAHNIKGACPIVGLHSMKDDIHRVEDFLTMISRGRIRFTDDTIAILFDLESYFRAWLDKLKEDPKFRPGESEVFARMNMALQNVADAVPTATAAPQISDLKAKEPGKVETVAREKKVDRVESDVLRVSVEKVDQLIQLVGEISLYQSILLKSYSDHGLSNSKQSSAITLMRKLTRDLQSQALTLRMVPVQGLFQKLERTARQASIQLKKPLRIVKQGEDVSLDRIVIEKIADPLIHVIRNALDHGLESPTQRAALGKPEAGRLTISAQTEAAGVVVRISDDGGGVDVQKVHQKAIEKKIISEMEVLTDEEKLHLLFRPGFSTAEIVTDISGRGVGLDVVLEVVEQLGGRVDVETKLGEGTTFLISLPTTINLVDSVVVGVAGRHYAIPNQDLAEIIDLKQFQLEASAGARQTLINLRGEVLPVERLQNFIPVHGGPAYSTDFGPALIVDVKGRRIAFAVDELFGQQQVFVRPLPGHLSRIPWLSGTTILTDGEPSLLINILEIAISRIARNMKGEQSDAVG